MTSQAIIILLLSLIGAVTYRWRGTGAADTPSGNRTVNRALFALTLGACGLYGGMPMAAALLVPVVAFPGIVIGHGSYMDLGTNAAGDDEPFRPLLNLFFGPPFTKDPVRDAVGLALTGVAITLPIAVLLGLSGMPVWYAAVGMLKSVSYALGFIAQRTGRIGFTVFGEYAWGACAAGFLAAYSLVRGDFRPVWTF